MTRSRLFALAAAAALLAMTGAPTAVAAGSQAPGCDVDGATLTWGFKESFRAYIDGNIANGEWETSGDATYATPEFTWSNGEGRYNSDTGVGLVRFDGSVRFTGHGGVLDTTISDPAIVLSGDTATLLLSLTGESMAGEPVDAVDVEFAELIGIDVAGEDARITVDAGTLLTDAGETAFPEYQAGDEFDPVEIVMPTSGECAAGDFGDAGPGDGADGDGAGIDGEPASDATDPVLIAFVVLTPLIVLAVVLAIALGRRRRG